MFERILSVIRSPSSESESHLKYRGSEAGGADVNVAVSTWDAETIRTAVGEPPTEPGDAADQWWADFDDVVSRQDGPEPITQRTEHNTTCEALHVHLSECLNWTTRTGSLDSALTLALGNGSNVAPAVGDTELVSKQAEFAISGADTDEGSRSTQLRAALSTDQGNGIDISEVGVIGPNGLWNHAGISPVVTKTNSIALTIEVMISVRDASEVTA